MQFDAANNSVSRWSFSVPDDWDTTSNLTMDVFWSPSDVTAGNVVFTLNYASFASGTTVAAGSFTSTSNTVAAPGTALQLGNSSFTLLNANLGANRMVDITLNRDPTVGADTYAGNANIHMIRLRYQGKKIQ
jgi:hypothetical protein